jgi:hypothetical protein
MDKMDKLITSYNEYEIKLGIKKITCGEIIIRKKDHSKVFLWACWKGHLEIVKLLIATPGFNELNTPNIWETTPIISACGNGHLEIVKLLIATPGFDSLNTPDNNNTTPILLACEYGYLEIVKVLIATPGFNSLNTPNRVNETPFYYACRNGDLEIIQILLLQDNLIRSDNLSNFSTKVQKRINEFDTNRTYYMKKYKTSLIIDIYRLTVFLSDGYLKIKSSRFFNIIKELPSELQIKIIFATINWNQTYILSEDFNDGLKEFAKKI